MTQTDPKVRPHRNRLVRGFFLVLGTVLLGIGILGMILPLLPATIFLLGAAACYARASERFYEWLLGNRWCGPVIREWREHRTVSRRARRTALVLVIGAFTFSALFVATSALWRIVLALVGVGVVLIVWRLPVRERPDAVEAGVETVRGR